MIKAITFTTALSETQAHALIAVLPATITLNTVPAAESGVGWSASLAARELTADLIKAGATARIEEPEQAGRLECAPFDRSALESWIEEMRTLIWRAQGIIRVMIKAKSNDYTPERNALEVVDGIIEEILDLSNETLPPALTSEAQEASHVQA